MRFVIVTGMSGAGKSTAMKILEDAGYFCADNIPVPLIGKFADLAYNSMGDIDKVALGTDIRSGDIFELDRSLRDIKNMGRKYEILFLDAGNETLIRRYKETRRMHPLALGERVDKGISRERESVRPLRERADYIIDTDNLLVRDLRQQLERIFVDNENYSNLYINVVSFGFKYGIPVDADLVFDVRFMPNPYYIETLKRKTGNDKDVNDFVMSAKCSREFLDKLTDMMNFLIPNYIAEGKNQLVIGIGCTGGKHRSVTIANKIYENLKNSGQYGIKLTHRDIERE